MTDLTGADIRTPSMNTGVVSAHAIGVDDGTGRYVPLSGANPIPTTPGIMAPVTTPLVDGVAQVLDLTMWSSAAIQIDGLSADTIKVETSLSGGIYYPATLLKFQAGTSVLVDGTALTGSGNSGAYSIMGHRGYVRVTRTGNSDGSLAFSYKGSN